MKPVQFKIELDYTSIELIGTHKDIEILYKDNTGKAFYKFQARDYIAVYRHIKELKSAIDSLCGMIKPLTDREADK